MQHYEKTILWTRQIEEEYRRIADAYCPRLEMPALRISDSMRRLGAYTTEPREIMLSTRLFTEYSWDVVLGVLGHEMAHQYVHEIAGQRDEPPHGEAFQDACKILHVMPLFRQATGHVQRYFQDRANPGRPAAIQRKVEKLFALAQSSNEHEAALAMRKANALLRKYNLERLEGKQEAEYDYKVIRTRKKRLDVVEKYAVTVINDFFFVNCVLSSVYDPASCQEYRAIYIFGDTKNLAVAEYVYSFLVERVAHLWREYRKKTGCPGKERRSFVIGLFRGFLKKLKAQEEKDIAAAAIHGGNTCTALMLTQNDQALQRFVRIRFPHLRRQPVTTTRQFHSGAYHAGQEEGRRLTIHRGIAESVGNLGKVLPL